MAAIFTDWDGTVVRFGSDKPLPGALEQLKMFLDAGHQVFVTTARPNVTPVWRTLRQAGLADNADGGPEVEVLAGVQNPRVLINDMGAIAINHPVDGTWEYEKLAELPIQPVE